MALHHKHCHYDVDDDDDDDDDCYYYYSYYYVYKDWSKSGCTFEVLAFVIFITWH